MEAEQSNKQTGLPPSSSSDWFGDISHPAWRYSVICCKADHSRHVVATGLALTSARETAMRLDREYRERVEATGKHYSSWTADLHECQLESPNEKS